MLSVKKRIFLLLPSRFGGHILRYNVFELLRNSDYDTSFCFFAYSRSRKVDWSPRKSSWYPYDFDAVSVSSVEATVELGWKSLSDGVALVDHKLLELLVILVENETMSLSEARSKLCQLLVTW